MTVFDRLESMANRAVDRVNGEPFILLPASIGVASRRSPNGRASIRDAIAAGRAKVAGVGVFEYISIEAGIQLGVRKSYRESNDLRALQVGREPVISIDRRIYFPNNEHLPRQGDIVVLPDRPHVPTFEVVSSQPDGHGRIVLKLVARGPQPGTFPEEDAGGDA